MGLGSVMSPTTECGIWGSYQCLELDGNSDYFDLDLAIGEHINPLNGTISVWINIRANDGTTNQNIVRLIDDSTNNGVILMYDRSNTEFRAVYRVNGVYVEATYNDASLDHDGYMDQGWIHLAMTWNNDNQGTGAVKIYFNGAVQESVSQNEAWNAGTNVLDVFRVGSDDAGTSDFFDGHIDQLGIWESTLHRNQILAIHNGGVPFDLTSSFISVAARQTYSRHGDLIGYYQFEGNGLDSSGNRCHGTLNGTAGFSSDGVIIQ